MKRAFYSLVEGATIALFGLACAWLAFDILVLAYGEAPGQLIALLFRGTWGTAYGAGQVLYKATPLAFAGLGVTVALRAGLFNVGAEGQMAIAALAAALVGARLGAVPAAVAVPLVIAAAAVAGAAWAAPAAVLRARYGVHEVISTILLNRIAESAITFGLASGLAVRASVRTPDVAPSARLARLERWVPSLHGSAVSVALGLAVVVVALSTLAFRRTRIGREFELVAQGPKACAAEGVPVDRRRLQALVLSGAVAGLAASATVLGFKGAYEQGLGAGAGFTGIAVALLGRGSFIGLLAASLVFGTLQQGGLVLNARVPMELMDVLQSLVIVAVALADRNVRALFTWMPKRVPS